MVGLDNRLPSPGRWSPTVSPVHGLGCLSKSVPRQVPIEIGEGLEVCRGGGMAQSPRDRANGKIMISPQT